jgi:hypothetical protein
MVSSACAPSGSTNVAWSPGFKPSRRSPYRR